MKILIAIFVLSIFFVFPASALETPGLIQTFTIETGGYSFDVKTTSNFDVTDHEFSAEEKRLTLFINSGLENNLSEIIIPTNLINGNFTFYLNEQEIFPTVKTSDTISFITVKFPGDGVHRLDIIGTTYLPEFQEIAMLVLATSLFGLIFLKGRIWKKLFVKQ